MRSWRVLVFGICRRSDVGLHWCTGIGHLMATGAQRLLVSLFAGLTVSMDSAHV